MAPYLGNSLIKTVLKSFESDAEILLLNFLMYLQIAKRYLYGFTHSKLKSALEF